MGINCAKGSHVLDASENSSICSMTDKEEIVPETLEGDIQQPPPSNGSPGLQDVNQPTNIIQNGNQRQSHHSHEQVLNRPPSIRQAEIQNGNQPQSFHSHEQVLNRPPSIKHVEIQNQPQSFHSQQQILNQVLSSNTAQNANQPLGTESQKTIPDMDRDMDIEILDDDDDDEDDDDFPTQELRKRNSATQQIRHMSLYKEILSPIAKGVQSVPIFSATQAKKYADAGFIKPHESKAQLSLLNVASPGTGDNGGNESDILQQTIAAKSDNTASIIEESPIVPSDQGSDLGSDKGSVTNSSTGAEDETIVAVHMQSLSLSALDQQPSTNIESHSILAENGLGKSSTVSDTRLLVIKQSNKQQPGKTRSKSHSFLRMSSANLKVLKIKSCLSGGASSSDEAGSYKSSFDETANARSDDNVNKRKKKQKKKKKWRMKKITSDTAKDAGTGSEIQEQHSKMVTMKQQHHPLLGMSPNVSRDILRTDSNTLEWDHFGDLSSGLPTEDVSDKVFDPMDQGLTKPASNIMYHPDMLSIFGQIEQEGGPKMTAPKTRRGGIDPDALSLQISLLHLHRKKEDIQKLLKVTQEQLWEATAEMETLQTQLTKTESSNQHMMMTNMQMEEQLHRSAVQLLQVRSELGTKITVLEREIDRLQNRLQECCEKTDSGAQTSFPPLEKPYKQNGLKAELKTLQIQNSYLQQQLCQAGDKFDKQRLVSQSFTQLAEYLKFRLLDIEEQLITEKQQINRIIENVSVSNIKGVAHNPSDGEVRVVEFDVELGSTTPEGNTSAAEIKSHVTWIQQTIEVIVGKTGQLENAVKITIEELLLDQTNLKAELDSMRSKQEVGYSKCLSLEGEVDFLTEKCLQLCEDNDRLEDFCVQHAKEIKAEKDKYDKMFSDDMCYGKLIVNHQEVEDEFKHQLVVAQEECKQAKQDGTDKIHQLSALQKKCSDLITVEGNLRKELEHLRQESQHTISRLQEDQMLAISSLKQKRSKSDSEETDKETDKQAEIRLAFRQVCETLRETTQQNLNLKRQCQSLEENKKEQENHLKDLDNVLSETMKQLDEAKTELQQNQLETGQLTEQYRVLEKEKWQQDAKIKEEADTLKRQHQQNLCQLQHNKRLVEELQQMVKKQELEHDEVLEELLQRNVEHDKAVEQIQQSTACIQELQVQIAQINADKERQSSMLESQLQQLFVENQQLKTQLQSSNLLMNEHQNKEQQADKDRCDKIQQSAECIQELKVQLAQINANNERQRSMIELQLHQLFAENQQLKTQLQSSNLLMNEHQNKEQQADKDRCDKIQQSAACIQELQVQLAQINADKDRLRDVLESQLQQLVAENQHLKTQLQSSNLMMNEHQNKEQQADKDRCDKEYQRTTCIQELQMKLMQIGAEKDKQTTILESRLQGLQAENQNLHTQLQDSQHLINEHHVKCLTLSEDLKSATTELTKRDCHIENLRQELAISKATKQKELETKLEELGIAKVNLENRLCCMEGNEKELRASESSLKVQLAVQMQTVRMLEDEKKKNAGLEKKIQALENQLTDNKRSLEASSSSAIHQTTEIKMLNDAVKDTRNQLKALIEDKMHMALLGQMQEKQGLTDKLTEAISVIDKYEECYQEDAEIKHALSEKNDNLQEECKTLVSLLEEEKEKYSNMQDQMEDCNRKLAAESQEKLLLLKEKEIFRDLNQNIFHHASNISGSLSSLSNGQNSELLQLRDSSGKLATDIQLLLTLPSNGFNSKDVKPSSILDNWSNSFRGFTSNTGSQLPKTLP